MYLDSGDKRECFGCGACLQVCTANAITMAEDDEGFLYPSLDVTHCISCGRCREICPCEHIPEKHKDNKYTFGGYHLNSETRFESTSGGAFSAVVEAFCDENYVIFGAEAKGLRVFHSFVTDKNEIGKYRKSKYAQSIIGLCYRDAQQFLSEGKKVVFSGTPCQIAGLLNFLCNTDTKNLLTLEVVCEGVPSPLYVKKLDKELAKRYGTGIESIDYRYTGHGMLSRWKWDFQITRIDTGKKAFQRDRWFNPFWSIWLQHLMSRPSCYRCPFTTPGRVSDITLGDLWGVHLYCPELYGNNGGASLVVCNTDKGRRIFQTAQNMMYGHELLFEEALKYQSPLKKTIDANPHRDSFMKDLKSDTSYKALNRKWAKRPDAKLLTEKYLWGNRQKIAVCNLLRKLGGKNA